MIEIESVTVNGIHTPDNIGGLLYCNFLDIPATLTLLMHRLSYSKKYLRVRNAILMSASQVYWLTVIFSTVKGERNSYGSGIFQQFQLFSDVNINSTQKIEV